MGSSDEEPAEHAEVRIDEGALYVVVRKAVEDAMLGVIGTLLLVGVALVLVWVGGAIAISAGVGQPLAALLGVAIAAVGLYFAAATLELIPPVREWL